MIRENILRKYLEPNDVRNGIIYLQHYYIARVRPPPPHLGSTFLLLLFSCARTENTNYYFLNADIIYY